MSSPPQKNHLKTEALDAFREYCRALIRAGVAVEAYEYDWLCEGGLYSFFVVPVAGMPAIEYTFCPDHDWRYVPTGTLDRAAETLARLGSAAVRISLCRRTPGN